MLLVGRCTSSDDVFFLKVVFSEQTDSYYQKRGDNDAAEWIKTLLVKIRTSKPHGETARQKPDGVVSRQDIYHTSQCKACNRREYKAQKKLYKGYAYGYGHWNNN